MRRDIVAPWHRHDAPAVCKLGGPFDGGVNLRCNQDR